MAELSHMQQRIYDYIVSCIREQGYPPSLREIGEAVGLKSPSTVHFHLKHLEEAGVIEKGAGKGRAIALTEPAGPEDRGPIVGQVAAGSRSWPPQSLQIRSTAPRCTAMEYCRQPQVQPMPPRAAMSFSSERTSYMITLSVKASGASQRSFSARSSSSAMAFSTSACSPI